jgi:asparagine N-glycosylation enzyme membrane subunit Stt3
MNSSKKEVHKMGWIQTKWTAEQADNWSKEDYLSFILSPLIYFLLALGVALSLLLLWYGWVLLGVSIILLVVLIKIIDPKLKATSRDYEIKQKKYLEDLEKIARWEE